jgi:hypothetical protein
MITGVNVHSVDCIKHCRMPVNPHIEARLYTKESNTLAFVAGDARNHSHGNRDRRRCWCWPSPAFLWADKMPVLRKCNLLGSDWESAHAYCVRHSPHLLEFCLVFLSVGVALRPCGKILNCALVDLDPTLVVACERGRREKRRCDYYCE